MSCFFFPRSEAKEAKQAFEATQSSGADAKNTSSMSNAERAATESKKHLHTIEATMVGTNKAHVLLVQ